MEDYLNVNKNFKYEIIKQVVDGKKSKQWAECELGLSRRQIKSYIQWFSSEGRIGFKHKNKRRKCSFAISNELKQQIISLYIHKYNGFNFVHFHKFLSSNEEISISLSSLRNILAQANCLSPRARKVTRRNLKKKFAAEKKNLNNPLTSSLSSTEVETVPLEKAHPSRSRKNMQVNYYRWMLRLLFGLGKKRHIYILPLIILLKWLLVLMDTAVLLILEIEFY